MAKSIIVCCDGTWNRPATDTNIWRTFRLLCEAADFDRSRIAAIEARANQGVPVIEPGRITVASVPHEVLLYYDSGVGTERKRGVRGGALALGIDVNVSEAYACLQAHWSPGDQIFAFGFSRGAFTVRALGGMLSVAGLVPGDPNPEEVVRQARAAYITPAQERERGAPAQAARTRETAKGELAKRTPIFPTVRFLGVYDTVGSLGVPVPRLGFLNRLFLADLMRFGDTRLGSRVEIACQALAIHERRGAFKPAVWSRAPRRAVRHDGTVVEQKVHQVWFTGSHGDVGGGHGEDELSNIALNWMLARAIEAGLPLEPWLHAGRFEEDVRGPRHDSSQGWLGRVSSGEAWSVLCNLAGSVPFLAFLPLRAATGVLDLFTIKEQERCLGGENVADDGALWVGVGEAIHPSVLGRYAEGHRPANLVRGVGCGLSVWSDAAASEPGWPAKLDGRDGEILNVTAAGLQARHAGPLDGDRDITIESGDPAAPIARARARLVWTNGERAGLRLLP